MVNAHIDYRTKKRDNQVIERAHRLPGNHLLLYGDTSRNGFVFFGEDVSHDIRVIVRDFAGNKAQLDFNVITYSSLTENPFLAIPEGALLVTNTKGIAIHKSNLDVVIPEGAVYEDLVYSDQQLKGSSYLSDMFVVGDEFDALNVPISVGIKPYKELEDSLKPRAVIVHINQYGELKSCGGQWNGKFLTAKSGTFGTFALTIDTVPPSIEKEYVPADLNTMYGGVVMIKIKDELSGVVSYSGKIDDKWTVFEYDKKNNMVTANVDQYAENKEHTIELMAMDERGNKTVWKSSFYY
jgi:hypothetical protein